VPGTPSDTILRLFSRVGGAGELESKRRSVAAKPLGEEGGPAASRGTTPARIATIAALAVAVIVLAVIFFGGSSGHKYTLIFQNAGQLVPDNQVLIGGSPAGTVKSLGLTDDNLAEVNVEIDQELHEGTTAIIRATSLSGVANHYVSISPGPNSNPALDDRAELGLASTTTPVDIDQFFNTFPPRTRKGLSDFIRGNAAIYSGQGENANDSYKYFGSALNRTTAFVRELNRDQRLLSRFIVSSAALTTAVAGRGEQLSSAIGNANTAFDAIAGETAAFDATLRRLPPVMRQSNTTFVNLRAALDDIEPLIDTAKPATKDLAPFLRELRPVFEKLVPFTRNLKLVVRRPGNGNDAADLLATMPRVADLASSTFPHSEQAISDFQPNLNFIRAYTPDLFNALGKLGQVAGYYDGNGHYVRAATSAQNLFRYTESGELEPISRSQQYEPFGSTDVKTRCPGGATQPAADGSSPWVGGGSVDASECDPNDVPPGP
jgi:phospholipid/cholesterol/gamma-HCH transport system substrate-binding protein